MWSTLRGARRLATAAAPAGEESASTRRLGTFLFSGLVGTTGCLTAWQLQRYSWKVSLVEERTAALQSDPQLLRTLLPDLSPGVNEVSEFKRVLCTGEFDHAAQVLLGPRSAPPASPLAGGSTPPGAPTPTGWDVITPLQCSDGSRILVNRGWVPREATAAISHPTGEQHFSGVLKRGEARNKYAHNDIEGGLYRWLDLSTIAKETASAPVLVVATTSPDDEAGGRRASYPRKRPLDAFLNFYVEPSTHLVYAATWASLTVAGAFMTFKRFR
jgi:surfeit locus 1 family protein